jgi:hypothetical protein
MSKHDGTRIKERTSLQFRTNISNEQEIGWSMFGLAALSYYRYYYIKSYRSYTTKKRTRVLLLDLTF